MSRTPKTVKVLTNKYASLLEEVKKEHNERRVLSANNRTLVVDGLNTFIRSFSVDPTCNENGVHIGGITGFLKSIGYAIKLLSPTRVIIVFDGKGGSQRRRKLYPEYKANRKVSTHYNRNEHISLDIDERESMKMQLGRLLQYLEYLPVKTIIIDNIEADDVIAYITNTPIDGEKNKYYIMSSDKDFFQLVCDNVQVWSPTKKKLYNEQDIFDEFGVSSQNYIFYRVLDGDVSDNIGGVRGAGPKTIVKSFPLLTENTAIDIKTLLEYSKDKSGKIYENVLNSKDILDRNYQLMQLKDVDISGDAKLKILNILRSEIPLVNRWEFGKMALEDYINTAFPNLERWLKECFQSLNNYAMKYAK